MLARVDLALFQGFARAHGGEPAAVLVVDRVVLPLLIKGEEAVELHHGAGGAKIDRPPGSGGGNIGRSTLEFGGFHLTGDCSQPD